MRRFIPLAVAALAAAGLSSAALAGAASAANAAPVHAFGASGLPKHIYAPYFEAYDSTDGGLAQLS